MWKRKNRAALEKKMNIGHKLLHEWTGLNNGNNGFEICSIIYINHIVDSLEKEGDEMSIWYELNVENRCVLYE